VHYEIVDRRLTEILRLAREILAERVERERRDLGDA
jgi:hypothetical protein